MDSHTLSIATNHTSTAPKPGFLRVAGEIRNYIYSMLLTNKYAFRQRTRTYTALHPSILQVNHQIYREAVRILYGENIWIIVEVDARFLRVLEDTELRVFRPDPSKIKYPALHITFAGAISRPRVTFVIGQESVKLFIQGMWRVSWKLRNAFRASSLILKLGETPFCKTSDFRSKCLNPFGRINGYKYLITCPGPSQAYRWEISEYILRHSSLLFDSFANIEALLQNFLDRGYRHYFAGRLLKAFDLCYEGRLFSMHVSAVRSEDSPNPLPFSDCSALWTKSQRVNGLLAKIYLAGGLFEEALDVGNHALKHGGSSIQDQVHVKVCIARAHRRLNQAEEESRLLEEALSIDDDKSTFLTALAELFPKAAPEQAQLIAEQRDKLQKGEAIEMDVIRAFWETV